MRDKCRYVGFQLYCQLLSFILQFQIDADGEMVNLADHAPHSDLESRKDRPTPLADADSNASCPGPT
jgi:hypothetical protein